MTSTASLNLAFFFLFTTLLEGALSLPVKALNFNVIARTVRDGERRFGKLRQVSRKPDVEISSVGDFGFLLLLLC
jgi:hypothetical protein